MSLSPLRTLSPWSLSPLGHDMDMHTQTISRAPESHLDPQPDFDSNRTHVTETQIEPDIDLEVEHLANGSQTRATHVSTEPVHIVTAPAFLQRPRSSGKLVGPAFKMAPPKKPAVDYVGKNRFPGQTLRAGSQETPPPSAQRSTSPGQTDTSTGPPLGDVQPQRTDSVQAVKIPQLCSTTTRSQVTIAPLVPSQNKRSPPNAQTTKDHINKKRKKKHSKSTERPKGTGSTVHRKIAVTTAVSGNSLLKPEMPHANIPFQHGNDILAPLPDEQRISENGASTDTHPVSALSPRPASESFSEKHAAASQTPLRDTSAHQIPQPRIDDQHVTWVTKPAFDQAGDRQLQISPRTTQHNSFHQPFQDPHATVDLATQLGHAQDFLGSPLRGHDGHKAIDGIKGGHHAREATVKGSRSFSNNEAIMIDDKRGMHPAHPAFQDQSARNILRERQPNGQSRQTGETPPENSKYEKIEKLKTTSKLRNSAIVSGPTRTKNQPKLVRSVENHEPPLIQSSNGFQKLRNQESSRIAPMPHSTNSANHADTDNLANNASRLHDNKPSATARLEVPDLAYSTDDLIKALQERSRADRERMKANLEAERAHLAENASLFEQKSHLEKLVDTLSAENTRAQERILKFSDAMQGPNSRLTKHQNYMTDLANDLGHLRSEYRSFRETQEALIEDQISKEEQLEKMKVEVNIVLDRVKQMRDPGGPLTNARIEVERLHGLTDTLQKQLEEKTGMLATERDRNARLEKKIERDALENHELKDLFASHRRSIMDKLIELQTMVDLAKVNEEDRGEGSKLEECLGLIREMRAAEKVTPEHIENINTIISSFSDSIFAKFDKSDAVQHQAITVIGDIESNLKSEILSLKDNFQSQHDLIEQVATLREQKAVAEEQTQASESLLADLRRDSAELQSANRTLQQMTIELKLQIEKLEARPVDSQNTVLRLQDAVTSNEKLNSRLYAAQEALGKAEGRLQAQEEGCNRLSGEITSLKSKLEDAQLIIASFDQQKVEFERKAEAAATEIKLQFENENCSKSQQLKADYNEKVRQLAQLRQDAEDRSSAAREEVKSYKESEHDALGRLSQLRSSEASLTIKNAELRNRNDALEKRINSLDEQLVSKEADIQNHEESQASLENELRQVSQSLEIAYSEGKKDKALIVALRADVEGLRTQLITVEAARKSLSPRTTLELQLLRKKVQDAEQSLHDAHSFKQRCKDACRKALPSDAAIDDPVMVMEILGTKLVELQNKSQQAQLPLMSNSADAPQSKQTVEVRPRRRANRNNTMSRATAPTPSSITVSKAESTRPSSKLKVTFNTEEPLGKVIPESQHVLSRDCRMKSPVKKNPPATPNFARFEERFQITSPLTPLDEVNFVEFPSPSTGLGTVRTAIEGMSHIARKHPQTSVVHQESTRNPMYEFSDESPPQETARRAMIEENKETSTRTERHLMPAMATSSPKALQSEELDAPSTGVNIIASRRSASKEETFKALPGSVSRTSRDTRSAWAKAVPLPSAFKRKRSPSNAPTESNGVAERTPKKPANRSSTREIPDSQSQSLANGMFQQSSQTSISNQSRAKSGQAEQAQPARTRTKSRSKRTYATRQRYDLREERFRKELDK